jgi:hypothetical protein
VLLEASLGTDCPLPPMVEGCVDGRWGLSACPNKKYLRTL